jgi:hypothetical protein
LCTPNDSHETPQVVNPTWSIAKNAAPVTTPPVLLPPGSLIDIHEARGLDYQLKNHQAFMDDPANQEYMWCVFGADRMNQLKSIKKSMFKIKFHNRLILELLQIVQKLRVKKS